MYLLRISQKSAPRYINAMRPGRDFFLSKSYKFFFSVYRWSDIFTEAQDVPWIILK